MNAYDKIKKFGQEQLLRYEHELSEAELKALLSEIEKLDFNVLSAFADSKKPGKRGKITPLSALELSDINEQRDEYLNAGIEAVSAGKVGAVLLAGGMGTRLGLNAPKGVFNVGLTRELYIFECLINNLMDSVKTCGAYIPLFVMTSELNHDDTVAFFKAHDNFGYPGDKIYFFVQEMAPCCDDRGKVLLEGKSKVATSPNGNAGWYVSMIKAGLDKVLESEGIEWLNIFAVDNVLQRICDPVFIGATILKKCDVGAKVVRKNAPDERVGVMCLEDGHPSIIEYYELTDQLRDTVDERGERVYNFGVILNYLFRVEPLKDIVDKDLTYHVVRKKIPYLNEAGERVEPAEPNGYKFEQLVLDMIYLSASCLPFEVERDREFAPIKNATGVDSVESARELLKMNGVEL